MANDNNVSIKISADVAGTESVTDLADRLDQTAKVAGGELAVNAAKAAAELRALGTQQEAIAAFGKLKSEAAASASALKAAEAEVAAFAKQIAAVGPPTAQEAQSLARLQSSAQTLQVTLEGQQVELAQSANQLKSYGIASDATRQAQNRLNQEMLALRSSAQALVPAWQGAANAQSAWQALGVKSMAQTQAEIAKINAALQTIVATSRNPLEIKLATQAAQTKIAELEGGVSRVGSATGSLSSMLTTLGPLLAATFSAQQFIGAITSAESLARSYEIIFGSTVKAREEMEWIKTVSNKLGMETLDLAKSYQSLAAATRGTTLEGKATRDVFEAVTRAMGIMGKSSDETKLALNAVAQMASKGTVSMEELRGQLGEALPGALKAAADGAGLTTAELIAMVETGGVLAKDLLPGLTTGLNKLYGTAAPPQTIISEWARFKNVVTETFTAIGEGGASKGIAKALTGLATGTKYAAAGFDILGTAIGEGAAALVTWNGQLTTSQDIAKKYGIATVEQEVATKKATEALKGNTSELQANFRQQELLAQKATESALAMQQRYTSMAKDSAKYIEQVEHEVAAHDAEAKVIKALVGVYGTEIEKRQAAAAAAKMQAEFAEKLASAQNTQAIIAQSYLSKLQAVAIATGDTTTETRKAIEAAQIDAAAKQTQYEKTVSLAQAQRIEQSASEAQAEATKDNSTRVGQYQAAMQEATEKVKELTQAHKDGKATDDQVISAKIDLAKQTLLYRDAVKDLGNAYKQLGFTSDKELGEIAAKSKAAFDAVSSAGTASTRELSLGFKKAAADAIAAANGIAPEWVRAQAAQHGYALAVDVDGKESIRTIAELTAGVHRLGDAHKIAGDKAVEALERQNAAQERANAATEKAIELENKRRGVDSSGFAADKDGKRIDMGGDLYSRTGIMGFLKSAGVDNDAVAQRIMKEFLDEKGNVQYLGNFGVKKYAGQYGTISQALLAAAEQYKFDTPDSQKQASSAKADATQGGPQTSKTYTVNIQINGQTQAVNMQSDADAQTLTRILQQIGDASKRAA